jgi:NhaP-type Na+/H+ or K+/H+ antiporter
MPFPDVLSTFDFQQETAIFAYLGLFLFSSRYHWNFYHVVIAIGGCCLSRAIMIPSLSFLANWITKIQQIRDSCRSQGFPQQSIGQSQPVTKTNKAAGVIVDSKMQLVLWFAGLRGAMSFALVEHIPQYDAVTGEGTRLKSELKAMTSASIIFTVFVLGGATFYMMEALGLTPNQQSKDNGVSGGGKSAPSDRELEMMGLMSSHSPRDGDDNEETSSNSGEDTGELYETSPAEMYTSSDHHSPRKPGRPGTFRRQRKVSDKQ